MQRSWPAYTSAFRALPDGRLFDGESYSGTWVVFTQVEDPQGFPLVSSEPLVTEGYDDGSHLERTVCTQDPPAGQSVRQHYGTTLNLRVADSEGSCTP